MSTRPVPVASYHEKKESHQQDVAIEQFDHARDSSSEDVTPEPEQHVHAKTLVLLFAIVAVYFVQVLHVAGNGLLSTSITTVTGGANEKIWLVSTLAISVAALGAPVSQASDYWGRKWFVVAFNAAGFVGCLIASRANSFGVVIGGQSIACLALGAQPLVHAIASEIIPRKYRSLAHAAVNIASSLGGAVGIMTGGALVRHSPEGFRVYFYITAALYGVTGVIVAWIYNPPSRKLQAELSQREKLARLDWYGYALFVPGLVLFSYALTSSSAVYAWTSPKIIGPLVVSVVLLITFIVYEWRFTTTGMLHPGLFSRGRNFAICLVLIFTEGLAFFAANTYFAFENVVLYDRSFFNAGLVFTVVFWTANVITVLTGLYVSHTKTLRIPLIFATTCVTLFFVCMATLGTTTKWHPVGYAVLLGAGLGSALNTVLVAAQLSTPPELISLASGLIIGMRSTGGTVGLSVFQAIFGGTLGTKFPADVLARVIPLDFDVQYTAALLGGLMSHNITLLESIPGMSPEILAAAGLGVKQAHATSFRNVWIAAAAFASTTLILSCFIVDTKEEFNAHIDAPVETEAELQRRGLAT